VKISAYILLATKYKKITFKYLNISILSSNSQLNYNLDNFAVCDMLNITVSVKNSMSLLKKAERIRELLAEFKRLNFGIKKK